MAAWSPHAPLPVENTWDAFVPGVGGARVTSQVNTSSALENADYLFATEQVVVELKEIESSLDTSRRFRKDFDALMRRVLAQDPEWRPSFRGGDTIPPWFYPEYVRLFRPPISRILKKANRQIRSTKLQLGIQNNCGVLILVNDGFTMLPPDWVRALAASLLVDSYSSIDCLVYSTLNRYIEVRGSDLAHLIWVPTYSDRAPPELQFFVNDLGRRWFNHIEHLLGTFDGRTETPDTDALRGSRAILHGIPRTR
jgi:hypothetical protein